MNHWVIANSDETFLDGVRVSLVLKASFAFYFIGNIIISKAELQNIQLTVKKKHFAFIRPEAAFAVFILS